VKALTLYFHLTKKRGVVRLREGFKFWVRPGKNDIQTIIEQFVGQVYTAEDYDLQDDSVILDIGANIGTFSVYITKYLKGKFRIFSYEPYPDNFELLKKNIELNKLEENVKIFQMGAGKRKETRELFVSEEGNAYHSMYFENAKSKNITIEVLPLKDIFETNNIRSCGFLKIDCEGAEYEILYNTPEQIYGRIKYMSIEYHPVEGYSPTDLQKFLSDRGFEIRTTEPNAPGYGFINALKTN
jgi:FkbM family methyltransferase